MSEGWNWEITGHPQDLGADTPILVATPWVLALFEKSAQTHVAPDDGVADFLGWSKYGTAALERQCGRLALTREGSRNHQLNASAYSLGKLVAAGNLTAEEVGDGLFRAAMLCGLEEYETEHTIRSGMTKGILKAIEVAS